MNFVSALSIVGQAKRAKTKSRYNKHGTRTSCQAVSHEFVIVHLQPLFSGLLFSCLTVTAASLAAGAETPETRATVETLVGHANDAEIPVALPVNRPANAHHDW